MVRFRREWLKSRRLWYVITGVLFAALLYFADIDEFVRAIRQVDRSLFAVAVAVGFSSLLVWAWVWHRFFGQMGISASPSQTVRMFLSGQFLNSITPLGQFGGEPVMAFVISETTDTDYENALACVVSSDFLNAAPFFTFTLGGVAYLAIFGGLSGFFVDIGLLAAALLAIGGVVAYLLWSRHRTLGGTVNGLLHRIEGLVGRAEGVFQSIRESVVEIEAAFERAGRDRWFLLSTGSVSHLAIVAQIVSLYFVFLALGLEPRIVPLYFIVTLSTLATLSPTPGGSGTYEAAFSTLMGLFYSVELATALTAAVLFRLTTYWPGLVVGYVSLLTLKTDREEI
ncbi:MAG: lysylphosphatidylglycerol synthase transmembrane domain-containing protein, partial [Halohasta sp.]